MNNCKIKLQYALFLVKLQEPVMSKRVLSIYEKNQLLRNKHSEAELLAQGEMPVEYLTGCVDFAGLSIKVTPAVLIPRLETEELLPHLLQTWRTLRQLDSSVPLRWIEVGAGSGALSLAFLRRLQQQGLLHKSDHFLLTDISPAALTVAQENLRCFCPPEFRSQVDLLTMDLLADLCQPVHLLVANLPYIPHSQLKSLPASVRDFEPWIALDGGPDGFQLIGQMLQQIIEKELLLQTGEIWLEVDQSHTQAFIDQHYPQLNQYFLITPLKDQFGRHRFLQCRWK